MRYLAWLIICAAGFAQEFRGTLLGRVTDPSGAVVPGVSITAIQLETNVSTNTRTNEEGIYRIPFLPPGDYRVVVEHPGFKRIERTRVRVSVASEVSLDFTLEVAAAAETLTVTAEAPLLNTASAELGQVVPSAYFDKLPVSLTRNAINRVMLSAVVTGDTGTYTSNAQSSFSVAGGGSTRGNNEVMVDGIPNTIARSSGIIVFVPTLDAIEEMKVHVTLFDAAYGHSNAGAVNITTKGGTNELRGTIYDYKRWRALNANSWSNNRLGLPRPPVNYNQFGLLASGPLYLPRLYDGRNRTFFSFSFETDRDARDLSRQARVPTELERKGDFSQTINRLGTGLLQIYDPLTTTGTGSSAQRTPFPGARIPASRLNPTGAAVAQAYPLPNQSVPTQIGRYNWAATGIYEVIQRQVSLRADHVLSQRQRMFGRISRLTRNQQADEFFRGVRAFPAEGTSDLGVDRRFFYSVALDDTVTFSPTMVASFRYGFSNRYAPRSNPGVLPDPSALSLPSIILQNQTIKGWPIFELGENFATLGSTAAVDRFYTHTGLATLYKFLGKHSLKFGVDYRLNRWNNRDPGSSAAGSFSFNSTFTQSNPFVRTAADTSGTSLASLLLGIPASGSLGYNSPLSVQNHYFAGFVQEEWRALPRLTLTLGLRWEFETPYTERYNRVTYGFDFDAPSPVKVPGLDLRGGVLFAGVDGNPRREGNLDTNNFGPRFGFALSLDRRTVIRGGYGLFYAAQAYQTSFVGAIATFNATTPYVGTIDNGATPYTTLANPFPNGLRQPEGNAKRLAARYGDSLTVYNQYRVNPYNQQWQLSIQRELPGLLLAEAAYMGMLSLKQLESFNLNEKPDRYLALGAAENDRVPNPFYGLFDPTSSLGAGTTIPQGRLWPRYPQYTSLTLEGNNTGKAIYHSLQLRLDKRFSHGFTFLWSYAFSKLIDNNTTSIVNERHYRCVSEYDVRHVMRLGANYELPFGPGRAWGSSLRGVWGRLVEGWTLSAWVNGRSGYPLSISHANGRPIRLRNAAKSGPVRERLGDRVDPATKRVLNPYFDIDAFAPLPNQYTVPPEPPYFDELRSPRSIGRNLALYKDVKIRERFRLQIRAEATNFTNSPSWGSPGTNMSNQATFGVIQSGGGGRSMQMGARLTY